MTIAYEPARRKASRRSGPGPTAVNACATDSVAERDSHSEAASARSMMARSPRVMTSAGPSLEARKMRSALRGLPAPRAVTAWRWPWCRVTPTPLDIHSGTARDAVDVESSSPRYADNSFRALTRYACA
ncbi:Uncharacterised protein [Mycobacteroides abscessus subsp. abscessus]|nr:Uncharacterised protein [Mycobacteroides abscessus subsp. abscessus]